MNNLRDKAAAEIERGILAQSPSYPPDYRKAADLVLAIPEIAGAPSWQPIETAPNFSIMQEVLVSVPGEYGGVWIASQCGDHWTTDGDIEVRPSHWMPLPEAHKP